MNEFIKVCGSFYKIVFKIPKKLALVRDVISGLAADRVGVIPVPIFIGINSSRNLRKENRREA
jgi:hypothetical protein